MVFIIYCCGLHGNKLFSDETTRKGWDLGRLVISIVLSYDFGGGGA